MSSLVLNLQSVSYKCLFCSYLLSCEEGRLNESIFYTLRHSCQNQDWICWHGRVTTLSTGFPFASQTDLPVGVQSLRAELPPPCFMIICTPQHCPSALHTTLICCVSPNPNLHFSACAGIVAKLRSDNLGVSSLPFIHFLLGSLSAAAIFQPTHSS